MLEARINRFKKKNNESERGFDLYLDVLHVQIFIQTKYFEGQEILVKIIKNAGGGFFFF